MLLTPQERRRFVDYCRIEAESLSMMARQMEKMPTHIEAVSKHYKAKAAAFAIVARELDAVEDMSVGPSDVGGAP